MFEAVRKNKRVAQLILAVIIVPFAFFGMDSYFSDGAGGPEVAKVGDYSVTSMEFDEALRARQDRIRRASNGEVDPALFATREFRRAVLENLVNDRVLAMYAADSGLAITGQQLQDVIGSEAAFQEDGKFSRARYEQLLQAQGMSPAMFEARLAQDMQREQVVQSVGQSAFAGQAAVRRLVGIQLEERRVSSLRFAPEDFAAGIEISPEAIEAHYTANMARYTRPERLRAEYVVFDRSALAADVTVDEAAVRAYYDANQSQYGQPEERRARHILVRVQPTASEAEVESAREKAAALLAEVRAAPERFAEIARESSQDPGSAGRGGDLGFFAPGAMVPAFDEAVFGRDAGTVGDLVKTDFGFHIIEVTEIKPPTVRPFGEVRDEIADELRNQEAQRRFPVIAEQFVNTVYEQPDSLASAAELIGAEVRTTDWISRADGEVGGYQDRRILDALFDPKTRAGGENIEAVEVERGTLVSARVVEYEEARQLALDEVRSTIETELRDREATQRAQARGEEVLAALRAGETAVPGKWTAPVSRPRGNPGLPPVAAEAVFSAKVDSLPAYAGALIPGGSYTVFRIESVTNPEYSDDDRQVQAFAAQYDRLVAEQEFAAFVLSLRERYGVEIRATALDTQSN